MIFTQACLYEPCGTCLAVLWFICFSVSHKNYWMCCDSLDKTRNDKLKTILNEYFDAQTVTEANTQPEILEESVSYCIVLCSWYSIGHKYCKVGPDLDQNCLTL